MLRFTDKQQETIMKERMAFNAQQTDVLNSHKYITAGNAMTLPPDVWKTWDNETIQIQRDKLAVFNELSSISTAVPIGDIIHQWRNVSDSGDINVSLDGRSSAKADRPVIEYFGTPMPILDTTFSFGWREMEAAKGAGFDFMIAAQANAARRVAEKLESLVLDGDPSISVQGTKLYGLRTAPNRISGALDVDFQGDNPPGVVYAEFVKMISALQAKNFYEGATIFLNYNDWFKLSTTPYQPTDISGYTGMTVLQAINSIPGVAKIVPAASIKSNEVIGIVKRREVYTVLNGMPITTRALFRKDPTEDYRFQVSCAVAVELKHDQLNQAGYFHFIKS